MSEGEDGLIAGLLNADAPPERDPVFRIKVLERREYRQFQRRSLTMFASTLVIVLVSALAISIGRGALQTAGAAIVGTALAITYPAFRRTLPRIVRRLSI